MSVFLAYQAQPAVWIMDLPGYLLVLISFALTFCLCTCGVCVYLLHKHPTQPSAVVVQGDIAHIIHQDLSYRQTSQPNKKRLRLQRGALIHIPADCTVLWNKPASECVSHLQQFRGKQQIVTIQKCPAYSYCT